MGVVSGILHGSTTVLPPGGDGVTLTELSGAPESWPDGDSDGGWGTVATTGAAYRWRASDSLWVAAEAYVSGTMSLFATIDGDEDAAGLGTLGYAVSTASGGTVTTATIGGASYVALDTSASASAKCNLSRSVTSGHGHYYAGRVQITNATGASASHCMLPYLRNGSRIVWLNAAAATNEAQFSPAAMFDAASNDLWTSPVWLEVLVLPDGTAYARADHGDWFASIGAAQCGATALSDEFIGDSSGTASATVNLRAFTTWDVTP